VADGQVLRIPVCARYLVNEATIEKVRVILKEDPQGVLYLRDGLSGHPLGLKLKYSGL
jgi:hypothetical protein